MHPNPWHTRVSRLLGGALLLAAAPLAVTGAAASAAPVPAGFSAPAAGPADLKEEKEKLNGPPGDNGTVKVHDTETSPEDMRNEPHVCVFNLVGSKFDGEQEVWWKIRAWPPGEDAQDRPVVLEGELTLDEDGHGVTEDHTLPDGHYKLFWNFDGEKGAAKHKVFWVDCDEESPEPDTPAEEAPEEGQKPDDDEKETDEQAPPEKAAPEESEEEAEASEESPSPEPAGESEEADESAVGKDEASSDLPVTGAALAGLVAAAATALGGGGAAMFLARKRKSQDESVEES
ncbi:hypothetical protein [Allosalinactinospora lopnorensis]|uniref:hypothetical protein n=1 Tax=Allosalinactinospora lopnorensis TaxID=1352348 RepID=UPI000696D502|nr:hypothetical protein [Allosalinactinospora lopnorensis]